MCWITGYSGRCHNSNQVAAPRLWDFAFEAKKWMVWWASFDWIVLLQCCFMLLVDLFVLSLAIRLLFVLCCWCSRLCVLWWGEMKPAAKTSKNMPFSCVPVFIWFANFQSSLRSKMRRHKWEGSIWLADSSLIKYLTDNVLSDKFFFN